MQKISKIMMMLSTIFFVSCNKNYVNCDISFKSNDDFEPRCRCRCINTNTLKETDKWKCEDEFIERFGAVPEDHPISYEVNACEGFSGFHLKTISKEIIPDIKRERAYCEDDFD